MSSQVIQDHLETIDAQGMSEGRELNRLVAELPGVASVEYVMVNGDTFQAHVEVTDDVKTYGEKFDPSSSGHYEPMQVWDVREALQH